MRSALGWAISLALVVVILVRVDGAAALEALLSAAPLPVAVALGLVVLEVLLRARRWQILLGFERPVPYRSAATYLCIGYFANTLLPARLGDVARAYLTGRDLQIPRLATFGTILVERIADAGLIVLAVLGLSQLTPAASAFSGPALALLITGGLAGLMGLTLLLAWRSGRLQPPRLIARGLTLLDRIATGGRALRSPRRFAAVTILTIAAFAVAIVEFWVVAGAVGVPLGLFEAGIVMGVLALSTSVPAAPGSVGTYELAGVAIMTQLGADPALALAAVVLMHVIATLPPALAGLAAFVHLQLRVTDLRQITPMEPAPA
jgi:uncharacterized membrane protein YbhN (UPF0104 family)